MHTAFVLGAGLGERLRPLTDQLPKPLIPVFHKPLITYAFDHLMAAGVTSFVVNTHHLPQAYAQTFPDGSYRDAPIAFRHEAPVRLETAGGIVKALPLLGSEAFAVVSGDIWTDYDFRRLQPVDGRTTLARLVMVDNPPHHPQGDFVLDYAGRLRLRVADEAVRGCTYSGISVMHPALFAGLTEEPLPLRPVLDKAIAAGQVAGEQFGGRWFDIGTPERLQELDALLRQ